MSPKPSSDGSMSRLPVPADLQALIARLDAEESELLRQLSESEERGRRFEDIDRPAYEAWIRLEFGPLLADLDELIDRIRERRAVAHRVAELVERGMRPREALYVVTIAPLETESDAGPAGRKARAGGWDPDEIEARRRAKRDAKREARRQEKKEKRRQRARERQSRETEGFGPIGDGSPDGASQGPPSAGARQADERRRRVVSLYRTLARRLHPDSADRASALPPERLRALWLETQEAYQSSNFERMQAIAAWLGDPRGPHPAGAAGRRTGGFSLTLSQRFERVRSLKRAVSKAEIRLSRLKSRPEWGFTGLRGQEKRKLQRAARLEIDAEFERLQRVMDSLEDFFDSIGSPKKPERG